MLKGISLVILMLVLTSCGLKNTSSPSVLVIAVSSLGFQDFNCQDLVNSRKKGKGFLTLCQESVRFTHVYTPSVLTAPAMASILTGLYPIEHQLHFNGSTFLPAKIPLVSEVAVQKGYRTAFFSGGGALWRHQGLAQGFELFEEPRKISESQMYFSAGNVFERFLQWEKKEVHGRPFFSVLYLPNLEFIQFSTQNEFGELRARSYEGQLEELEDSLGVLIRSLKKRGLWQKTHIFFVGIQGRIQDGTSLYNLDPLNLHIRKTQSVLLFKPAKGLSFKTQRVDENLSLVGLGQTLFRLLGAEVDSHEILFPHLKRRNFLDMLNSPYESRPFESVSLYEESPILLESRWSSWQRKKKEEDVFAIKLGPLFSFLKENPEVFHLTKDPQGLFPIEASSQEYKYIVNQYVLPLREKLSLKRMRFLSDFEKIYYFLRKRLFLEKNLESWFHEGQSYLKVYKSKKLASLIAYAALREKRWSTLESLGMQFSRPEWVFVARKRLKKKTKPLRGACLGFFNKHYRRRLISKCKDPLFRSFLLWKMAKKEDYKKRYHSLFLKRRNQFLLQRTISINNALVYDIWPQQQNVEVEPSLLELYRAIFPSS